MPATPKPLVLIVLDGWGYRENTDNNAIADAKKPAWDHLWEQYPHTLIHASEAAVGLPAQQMGNSEVGHLNLGAGRIVHQEYTRINHAIEQGEFFANKTLIDALDPLVSHGKALHILGLLSAGGVHSHEDQIIAMLEMAARRGVKHIYLHAFLDGRDTPPRSAGPSLQRLDEKFRALGVGRIASLIGRYYAMDRDKRWDRTQAAYALLTQAQAERTAPNAQAGLASAYALNENDEFVKATAIVPTGGQAVRIEDGDALIFMNFRADRARQLTRCFIEDNFDGFTRAARPKLSCFVSLTEYQADFHIPVVFPPERLRNVFGEYLANLGKQQLRIAETEKYAHVTFFFNGGVETPFAGEDRILIPSPRDVATYDQKPEMSAREVTDKILLAVKSGKYDVIICNFANADMVGHTGDFNATVRAIEALDTCIGRIYECLRQVGGEMLITADHGNAEQMYDPQTRQAHTAHTTNLVPFIYVGRRASMAPTGSLEDVAPTLLSLMGLKIPPEMSGHSLVELRRG